MKRSLAGEEGATTIEYTMLLGFLGSIAVYATISLVSVLLSRVAILVVNIATFLTGVPGP